MQKLTTFLLCSWLIACEAENRPDSGVVLLDAFDHVVDTGVGAPDASVPEDAGWALTPTVAFQSGTPSAPVNSIVYGAPSSVRAAGLTPGTEYEFRAQLWGFFSEARFVADEDGTIDTTRDAPSSGSYSGIEPEGLIWSMHQETNETAPNYDVSLRVVGPDIEPLQATLRREPMGVRAAWRDVNEPGVKGTLVVPDDVPPPPVVVVLGGSEGGRAEFTASYLSTFGVAAFAVGYFREPGLPPELAQIPIETVEAALDWLRSRTDVDATRVALYGGSRGSELAMMAAARQRDLALVIVEAPSDVRWASVNRDDVAAWTEDGIDLPYVPMPASAQMGIEQWQGLTGYRLTPAFEAALDTADAETLARAEIAVDQIEAPLIMFAGDDDGIWPSCRFAERARARRMASGKSEQYGDVVACFEGAGHGFGPPGWPTEGFYARFQSSLSGYLVLGGTPRGTATAQRSIYFVLEAALRGL